MHKLCSLIVILMLMNAHLQAQRNTILIIADDLSPDFFGFYETHGDTVDVPNIRALLKRGVRFKNFMTNPVCSSTRTSMFTGRYSFRTGVGGIVGGAGGSNPIDSAEITIPKLLKLYNPNIAKADIGKWHLSSGGNQSALLMPNKMGWDHFEGPFIGQLPSFTNWSKIKNGTAIPTTNYATTENVDNATAWIRAQNKKPFFLWLAFNAPHEPLHLPPSNLHTYSTLTGTAQDIKNNPKSYFKAMIQAMDHEMGRLFDTLKVNNQFDSTDIIFMGDNGSTPKTAQTSDTSKAKGTVYQYGVTTPMIFSGPSVVNKGTSSDALVNTVDMFATILELFGYTNWQSQIPSNKLVDSKSFMNVIRGEKSATRAWSFCEIFKLTHDADEAKAMRNKDYKLIRFDAGGEEFYNLSQDPKEVTNILKGVMTNMDSFNYAYLCNEMTTLVGKGMTCKAISPINAIHSIDLESNIYPNPFTSFIKIKSKIKGEIFELRDVNLRVIFKGENIDQQDFSELAKGNYYLKSSEGTILIKLVKE
jgi:arylsulfatase B